MAPTASVGSHPGHVGGLRRQHIDTRTFSGRPNGSCQPCRNVGAAYGRAERGRAISFGRGAKRSRSV
jgi:hypothetical protein